MSARGLILQSNVSLLCTTDDPADSLEWHKVIAEDSTFSVQVLPAFRPDNALYIEKDGFVSYVEHLAAIDGTTICTYEELRNCLRRRIDFFDSMGCKTADHGVARVMHVPCSEEEAGEIFRKKLAGDVMSDNEELA